jgi:hypothetical protein
VKRLLGLILRTADRAEVAGWEHGWDADADSWTASMRPAEDRPVRRNPYGGGR